MRAVASSIEIRDLKEFQDYEACVELQISVWHFPALDVVPAGHLVAMHHYGGVVVGAFDEGRMVGFVCGYTGIDAGRTFHHSHMLAVLPEYRGRRLGETLKWAQRDRVLSQGLDLINWTFDPLQAPNANLNINRLGCIVRKYIVNLYGESTSPLHGGIPTDRFEAEWLIKSERVLDAKRGVTPGGEDWESLPRANRADKTSSGLLACHEPLELDLDESALLVQLPLTITDVMAADRELALDWRYKLRTLFQRYFEKGYRVTALHRDAESAYYVLECWTS
jgi:predicted GNAT superfamily acetyltransferase